MPPQLTCAFLVLALLAGAGDGPAAALADLVAAQSRLEQSLMAPCCFHDTVAAHRSPASDAVREDIRQRLRSGESEAAILAAYEKQYGERILAAPHLAGFGLLAWLTPGAVLLVAGALVWRWLRRHQHRELQPDAAALPAPPDDERQARLLAELARFDG